MRGVVSFLLILLFPTALAYEVEYGGASPEYGVGGQEGPGYSPWGPENTSLPPSSDEWNIPSGENQVPPDSPAVLFTVEPTHPVLFMKIESADYYTGTDWLKTTESVQVQEEGENALTLAVEFQATTGGEFSLPVPSSTSKVFGFLSAPATSFQLLRDEFAGTFRLSIQGPATVRYTTTYHPSPSAQELEGVSWESLQSEVPSEVKNKCLQLPLSLPDEVKQVAESLRDRSLSPYRQALKVVEYLKTGFTYGPLTKKIERDAALTYLQSRQGHCFHANTTLAVLLRCLDIPARMVFGYQPKEELGGKLLYKPPGHAQVEVYFPPYGWVYFDATPPGEGPTHLPLDDPAQSYQVRENEQPEQPRPVLEFECQDNARRGENVPLFVRLTYSGSPLVGKPIQVLDTSTWSVLASSTTEETGLASACCSFPRTERVGLRYLTATFREGSLSAENTRSLLLLAETTLHLNLLSNTVRKGEKLEVSGRLIDDFGQGIPGQTIAILIDNHPAASITTDNWGWYSLSVPTQDLQPGKHAIQASFDPPIKGYIASKSANHTFEVTAGESRGVPWPLLALGVSTALLPLLILFKRKKAEEAPSPSASLRKMLEEFSSAKKYRDGIIAAYHQFLGMLVGSGRYEVRVNQTAREVAEDLAHKFEGFPLKEFQSFVEVYEKAMFSEGQLSKEEFDRAAEGICSTIDKMQWS
jgi:transglutaminase-like putative cysteine protease